MRTRGFTLVEMLVAVVVFMIFIGAIYGVYFAARSSADDVQEREDLYQTARVLLLQINTELCSNYRPASATTSTLVGEDGESEDRTKPADTLTFLTTAHRPSSSDVVAGDVCQVTYRIAVPAEGEPACLCLEEVFQPGLTPDDAEPELVKVSELVTGLNVKYLAKDGEDWVDAWVDQQELPAVVRVELTIQPREGKTKPIIVSATANLMSAPEAAESPGPGAPGEGGTSPEPDANPGGAGEGATGGR